jgi:DNA-binding response OmpR family regulator
MKRILVVEDDTANNRMMVLALEKRGYSCQPAYSGTEALLHLDKSWDAVWDDYYVGTDNTINVHISNIRKKMREVTEEEYIETVWGIGFRLHK